MDIQCVCKATSSLPCSCFHEVQDGGSRRYPVMAALQEEDLPYESPILTPPRTMVPHNILLEHVKQKFAHLTNVQQEEVIAITKRRFEIWLKEQVAEQQEFAKPAEFGRKCLSVPAPTRKETYCVDFSKAMQTFLGESEGGATPVKSEGDRKVKSLSGSSSPLLSVSTYGALRFSFDKFTLGLERDDNSEEPSPAIDYSDEEVFTEEI